MTTERLNYANLKSRVGTELGVSRWVLVGQDKIDQFADCTGDHQWIHIDAERARKESPLRTTIAHGYLSLSLVAALAVEIGAIPDGTQAAFNYGLDRVRFLSPVKSGASVRLRTKLVSVEDKGPGQFLAKNENTMEIQGEERPALIAETLVMLYERRKKAEG